MDGGNRAEVERGTVCLWWSRGTAMGTNNGQHQSGLRYIKDARCSSCAPMINMHALYGFALTRRDGHANSMSSVRCGYHPTIGLARAQRAPTMYKW